MAVRPSRSSTRKPRRRRRFASGKRFPIPDSQSNNFSQIVLRLECVQCKAKSQLALKRTKHFELGCVSGHIQCRLGTTADSFSVETRSRRVLHSFSDCIVSLRMWLRDSNSTTGLSWLGRLETGTEFPLIEQRRHKQQSQAGAAACDSSFNSLRDGAEGIKAARRLSDSVLPGTCRAIIHTLFT